MDETRPIASIKVGRRHRKDLGDLRPLAESLAAVGLLHPVVIDAHGRLVAGRRRLGAARLLGWRDVPVRVVDLRRAAEGELAENACRKDLLPSELWALARVVRPAEQRKARRRRLARLRRGRGGPAQETFLDGAGGQARDAVARLAGVSGRHLDKITFVCESGYPDLVGEMDATGKVDRAYREARRRKAAEAAAAGRCRADPRVVCADCREVLPGLADDTFDAAVTDPVFGLGVRYGGRREEADNPADYWRFFGPVYRELLRVVKPGGLVAVWQTAKWLPYFGQWYGRDFRVFVACKSYVQLYDTPMNHAYDPVVCVWKPGARPLAPAAPGRSLDYFVSDMKFDALARRHPCPRPLDLCEHFVRNFVVEGGYVLDAFAGSGTIPLACARAGRSWLAIERSRDYCRLLRQRLRLYGRDGGGPSPG
jgi:hypothetical protein